jgi:hypothetical protein
MKSSSTYAISTVTIKELGMIRGGMTECKNFDVVRSCSIEEVMPVLAFSLPNADAHKDARNANRRLAELGMIRQLTRQ